MAKVRFHGNTQLIIVNTGVTQIDVQRDVYSEWKRWMANTDSDNGMPNAGHDEAISAIGGEPITATQFVGITYFLENGWRIKMWEGSHKLEVDGNLYTREVGDDPYVAPDGSYKVTISTNRSNLVDQISGTTSLTAEDVTAIAANAATQVWEKPTPQANTAGTMGRKHNDNLTTNKFIALQE